jgi:hypothetical protein
MLEGKQALECLNFNPEVTHISILNLLARTSHMASSSHRRGGNQSYHDLKKTVQSWLAKLEIS